MRRVTVPPGCTGLDMQDGRRYRADRNGQVQVADHHANAIESGFYGQSGLIATGQELQIGTKATRWCTCAPGGRAWNAWNDTCPRCGAPTTEEKPS